MCAFRSVPYPFIGVVFLLWPNVKREDACAVSVRFRHFFWHVEAAESGCKGPSWAEHLERKKNARLVGGYWKLNTYTFNR